MKNGSIDKVRELQDENSNLYKEIEDLQKYQTKLLKRNDRISEEKDNMDRRFEETAMELSDLHCSGKDSKIKDLENKLDTIKRITNYETN